MKKQLCVFLLACVCLVAPAIGQEADKPVSLKQTWLELTGGALFLPGDFGTTNLASISFVNQLTCSRSNPNRPGWCTLLEVRITRRPPIKDPWMDPLPIVVVPPVDPSPWEKFRLSELDLGESLIFTPTLGIEFTVADRTSLGVFAGGGFQFTRAKTTTIPDLGTFRTTDSTSPILSFGANARYSISNGVSLKVEFQGLYTMEGNMDVIGPQQSIATFEGGTMFMPAINAGLGINLN